MSASPPATQEERVVGPVCQSSVVAGLFSQFILLLNMFRVPADHFVQVVGSKTSKD